MDNSPYTPTNPTDHKACLRQPTILALGPEGQDGNEGSFREALAFPVGVFLLLSLELEARQPAPCFAPLSQWSLFHNIIIGLPLLAVILLSIS